ncbi:hypothetical protein [Alcanivorax quisquiliarum]|uniref:Pilus assembly protein Flp/PilA n=1 Tax=Alcanivorax quisquiliarum TaxID=2933565 RepID=A0ABT0E579_9GAMM|nr:hypothetical protein [Alcanivorax quisquiliarum]MCK0536980.1 hypothetical protein [Alcanivorax quisquiliarum]
MKMTMKNGLQFFSFLNLLRAFGLAITQRVAANLSVVGWSARDRQRGASALEYIMLAAVIVGLLVVLAAAYSGENNPIKTFFDNLFKEAGVEVGE